MNRTGSPSQSPSDRGKGLTTSRTSASQDSLVVTSPPRRGASTSSTLTSPHRPSATLSADRRAALRESSLAALTHFYRRLEFSLKLILLLTNCALS